ncbi:tetratricopeptide repeat protein [Flavobacterium muglaense]|uniref:Tetratricopeptide repeat protein n=1 Tax=Flavobacterium muglaense TaxID=2764716 RepID=A0A923SI68_9FLAO|nr:tetratricopeptide repeat protein [Flavobacterium muglaense]MBC5836483.1 tetratricopeptide repeat protein [Flavobacterium muglaense]MBC5843013.1 tetratricopeptide repeat protein [Flavobacterium muglaense]
MNKIYIAFALLTVLCSYSQTKSAEDYYRLAKNQELLKNNKEAFKDYTQAIALDPTYEKAFYARALLLNNQKKYTEAINDYTKSIAINPKSSKAYYSRAISKNNLKDFDGALEDYSKTIELDSLFSKAYNDRAELKFKMNQQESGCIDLHKAGELGFPYPFDYIKNRCK